MEFGWRWTVQRNIYCCSLTKLIIIKSPDVVLMEPILCLIMIPSSSRKIWSLFVSCLSCIKKEEREDFLSTKAKLNDTYELRRETTNLNWLPLYLVVVWIRTRNIAVLVVLKSFTLPIGRMISSYGVKLSAQMRNDLTKIKQNRMTLVCKTHTIKHYDNSKLSMPWISNFVITCNYVNKTFALFQVDYGLCLDNILQTGL